MGGKAYYGLAATSARANHHQYRAAGISPQLDVYRAGRSSSIRQQTTMEGLAKKLAFGIKAHVGGEKRHGEDYRHNEGDSIGINDLAKFGLVDTTSQNSKTERMEEFDSSSLSSGFVALKGLS